MKTTLQKERIQSELLRWFKKNGRDLPWRKNRDPYAIWVSEIMLQQTQVDTVVPYYQNFLKSFPTVRHLAKAKLLEVLIVWEGLGYYSRARNLHHASQIILNRFDGRLPENSKELQTLPGIGRYTAGAILSIAFNKEAPILDGNVKRVLSRLFAIPGGPKKTGTENRLWKLSESLIPKGSAGTFNQALMDLGATVCTPKDPQCFHCPLPNLCLGYLSGKPESYPLRMRKKPIPHVTGVSAVIQKGERVLLHQRPPKGLLGGLWEFPNWKIEAKRKLRLRLRNDIKRELGIKVEVKDTIGTFEQTFSHFKLTLHVYHCLTTDGSKKGRWVPIKNLHLLPMSRINRRIAEAMDGGTLR